MIKKSKFAFSLSLFIFDLFILALLLYITIFARVHLFPSFLPNIENSYIDMKSYSWVLIFPLLIFLYEGLYTKRFTFWDEVKYIWKSLLISAIFIIFLLFFLKKSHEYSRLIIASWLLVSSFILPILRPLFKKILYKLHLGKESVLILGSNKSAKDFYKAVLQEDNLGYDIVGFVDDKSQIEEIEGIQILAPLKQFEKIIQATKIDVVAIALPNKKSEEISDIVNRVLYKVENVFFIPDIKEIPIVGLETRYFFKEDLLALEIKNNLASRTNFFMKRAFDYSFSLAIFPLLAPFMAIIAFLIKTTSKGPVIFVQQRVGKDGEVFSCYKFRTMYEDAEERLHEILEKNPTLQDEWIKRRKLKNDPRVTIIGKFLRKTSLDELPQIFNVLKGEMSLVGPRPYMVGEVQEMQEYEREYITAVYPGITGLWQVSGRSEIPFEERIDLDIWYVRNWSLWLDIVILFKTIKVIFKREGAY
ncbi:sugar transferase [Nitratiruptor sp. YY09-18]|uniref:sugar transferase n=1 Tax=Nitratiruptor sp. YY09-18 TaxID=2724901 RepID=UPI00191618A9|nr:sugar transferase [Nitratiruptor sp. YY09-18]BCD67296.1 undecaprenyl-phosphate galactose phosphotransferase [Nitratiruptor sp. YY09-18]